MLPQAIKTEGYHLNQCLLNKQIFKIHFCWPLDPFQPWESHTPFCPKHYMSNKRAKWAREGSFSMRTGTAGAVI